MLLPVHISALGLGALAVGAISTATLLASALSPLFGLALILFAFVVFDFRKDPAVVSLMVAVGCAALVVSYFLWRKVAETQTAIESCKFMKKRFDGCERWQPAELKENVQLAIEFLKRGMLKS